MVGAIVHIRTQRCFAAPLLEGPFMHCIGPHLYCPCIILYYFVLSCILVLSCICRCMCVVCCLFPCLLFSSCLLSVSVFVCLLSVSVYVCLLLMFSCFRVCCFIFICYARLCRIDTARLCQLLDTIRLRPTHPPPPSHQSTPPEHSLSSGASLPLPTRRYR